ncbi:MAG: hypothetical protein AABX05_01290 [Nanoarchaeota archaeon]
MFLSFSASAHLEGGIDLPTEDKVIDIGYDPGTLTAGTPIIFLLSLNDNHETEINSSSGNSKITFKYLPY